MINFPRDACSFSLFEICYGQGLPSASGSSPARDGREAPETTGRRAKLEKLEKQELKVPDRMNIRPRMEYFMIDDDED